MTKTVESVNVNNKYNISNKLCQYQSTTYWADDTTSNKYI